MHTAQLVQWLSCNRELAAPVRYRFIGQLVEVVTAGQVCELIIRDLAQFGNGKVQEGIRAVISDRLYEARFVSNVSSKREIACAGCAVMVCLGVILDDDGTRMFEVLDLDLLNRREVESLHSFACSSVGGQLIEL